MSDSHDVIARNQKRMLHHHKRQRVTDTLDSTTTQNARQRMRSSALAAAAAATDTTTTVSQHQRPSFLTASTRTTSFAPVASSSSVAVVTSSTSTADDEITSTSTTANTRNRGTTSSSSSIAAVVPSQTGFNAATATPVNASPKSNEAPSTSHGGAIAGAIIAIIAVLAIGCGFFVWRKRRNARLARSSGTGLIGGAGVGAASGGGYKKQDEDGDAWDGQGNQSSFARDDSSLFGGREKTFSQESMQNPGAQGAGGYGATSWNQAPPSQPQQQQQQFYTGANNNTQDAWNPVYPPSNQPLPASTANLLGHPNNNNSSNMLPTALAAGSAGAAGIGAARLLAAQSSRPSSMSNSHQSIEQRELQQELDNRRQSFLTKTQQPLAPFETPQQQQQQQSPFGDSEGQGEIRIVKGTFDPSLDDELVLYPGDKVQVLMKYDDGWALGLNLSSGVPPAKGVFPFDCLGEQTTAPLASEIRSPGSAPAAAPLGAIERSLSPINPANIPLPPPTPTLLSPINEDEQPPSHTTITSNGPPQLAPFERSDSPLSPDFPQHQLSVPSSQTSSPTKMRTDKLKRHSSLIASRDADLFVALGEVLDKERH
ncbi:uncharacterized protein JCM15063_000775 [Sporobolomyces koalae]|uniref:uncharacterized protein n=1 Tax=Sporobolomyces koalae TaxID=500713 RepID=UPI0031767BD0